jgi:hypothetical protein
MTMASKPRRMPGVAIFSLSEVTDGIEFYAVPAELTLR